MPKAKRIRQRDRTFWGWIQHTFLNLSFIFLSGAALICLGLIYWLLYNIRL